MVTKKTGRPPGRPKKHIVPKVKRPSRGQPRKPLTAWPNRYEYAFAEGLVKYQKETRGISRDQTALDVAKLFVSEIDPTTANIMAALRGDDFYIRPRPGCGRNGNKNSKEWRDKDVWHVYAAELLREIRKINEHPLSKDAVWLDTMSVLWRMAFSGASETKYFQWAKSIARYAGELQLLEAPNQARDDSERRAGGSAPKYTASDSVGGLTYRRPKSGGSYTVT